MPKEEKFHPVILKPEYRPNKTESLGIQSQLYLRYIDILRRHFCVLCRNLT